MSLQEQVVQPGVQVQRVPRMKGTVDWRNELVGLGFVAPFLIVYALFLLWPVLLGLRMSFYNWNLAGGGTTAFLGLGNYQELFADPNFWSALGHTILFTVLSTPILVVLALVLALLVNRAIPAKWLFRLTFFAPFVLPVTVVVIIWNWLFTPGFGLIISLATVVLASMAAYAFSRISFRSRGVLFWIILAGIMIPGQVLIVPLFTLMQSFGMVAILTFVASWNNFIWPFIVVTDTKMMTVPVGLATVQTSYGIRYAQIMASALLGGLPAVIIFLFFQRQIVEGLAGGLKE